MMSPETQTRLFDPRPALEDGFVRWAVFGILAVLGLAYALTFILSKTGVLGAARRKELIDRLNAWAMLIPQLAYPSCWAHFGSFWPWPRLASCVTANSRA